MRVLVDTTYTLRGPSGTATYLAGLVPALREAGVDVVEVANERRRPPGTGSTRNWLADAAWVQRELPRRARTVGADVVHHPLPAHARAAGTAQVITVHDLAFERLPEAFDRRYAAWARRAHRARRPARRRRRLRLTEATAARRARALGRAGSARGRRAPTAPGSGCRRCRRSREPRHFLYVGDDEPRKNLAALRAAHARYRERAQRPLPLVVAGAAGEPVSPERLAALYAGAAAVVHPALHEGFGLTLAEAMRAGAPVLAGRSPAVERGLRRRRPVRRPARSRGPGPRARAARGRRGAAGRARRTRSQPGREGSRWAAFGARPHQRLYALRATDEGRNSRDPRDPGVLLGLRDRGGAARQRA